MEKQLLNYSDRLNYAIEVNGTNQSELARAVGVKAQAIQYLCSGGSGTEKRSKFTQEIAEHLNINPQWLTTGKGEMWARSKDFRVEESSVAYEKPDRELNLIPLISWVQAGSWSEIIENYNPEEGLNLIPTTAKTSDKAYAVKVNGDSMEPKFPEGSILIVDTKATIEHKSYVIAKLENSQEATFKQYIEEGGKKFLKPLNPRYPIFEINENTIFCGRVVMSQMEV